MKQPPKPHLETESADIPNDFYRYLDFAESQHLRAISDLCQSTDDQDLYRHLLAHKEEVERLIMQRRNLFEGIDSRRTV